LYRRGGFYTLPITLVHNNNDVNVGEGFIPSHGSPLVKHTFVESELALDISMRHNML